MLAQGRVSLVIGLVFLSACLVLGKVVLGNQPGAWALVAREGLTIVGWVAMWRPMQTYLYDWWPLLRRERIYQKLSHMPVEIEVRAKGEGGPKNEPGSHGQPQLAPGSKP
jgi:hypothetical protein